MSVPIPMDSFFLPLKLPDGVAQVSQLAIWPHELFNSLYTNNKKAFELRVCPSPERLRQFWKSQEDHPNYPILAKLMENRPGWQSKAVPLKTHGDGCPVVGVGKSWSESQDFCEWVSLVFSM